MTDAQHKFAVIPALAASLLAAVLLAGCEVAPKEAEQLGYRGVGMEQVTNPALEKTLDVMPPAPPPATSSGPKAGEVYQNVQVLGDLSVAEFTRYMTYITSWVSPEQGCNYCHEGNNLASDALYTKVVSRRMMQMTSAINNEWGDHHAGTGVSCYTCHRGMNVPEYIWTANDGPPQAPGMAGWRDGQNVVAENAGYTSLPYDSLSTYLSEPDPAQEQVRVQATTALPAGTSTDDIKAAEHTYALMMNWSQSLGVNCTYCHNSRAFGNWEQSTPARTTAWHGLQMVRNLNSTYLDPLASVLPPNRKSPEGEAPKVNCASCHQGVNKPLGGAPMLVDYPELTAGSYDSVAAAHGWEAPAEALAASPSEPVQDAPASD